MSMNTPFDVFATSLSNINGMMVNGLRTFDNFGKSTLSTFSKGIPAPQDAMTSLLSFPSAVMPKGALPLALPNLGAVTDSMNRSLNLALPNMNAFGQLLPQIGAVAEAKPSLFGEGKKSQGQSNPQGTQAAASKGVTLF